MSEKLNKLAAKLLDLSKRNNLVHFKELKKGARKFQQINEAYELVKKHLEV